MTPDPNAIHLRDATPQIEMNPPGHAHALAATFYREIVAQNEALSARTKAYEHVILMLLLRLGFDPQKRKMDEPVTVEFPPHEIAGTPPGTALHWETVHPAGALRLTVELPTMTAMTANLFFTTPKGWVLYPPIPEPPAWHDGRRETPEEQAIRVTRDRHKKVLGLVEEAR